MKEIWRRGKEDCVEYLQEDIDEEGEDVDGDQSSWREWKTSDTKFNKSIWTCISGYKPPQGEQPKTLFFRVFPAFFFTII